MKKVILTLCLVLGAIQFSQSQIDFGIKAGVNYNADSFNAKSITNVSNDITGTNAKSKTGFHAGIWTRFKLPIVGLYIRPELVYTSLKSETSLLGQQADFDFQKIGKSIF